MRIFARLTIAAVVISATSVFAQQDPYDGQGDSSNKPDIWATPAEDGQGGSYVIITPGDGQPVDQSGNNLNFDTTPSPDSEMVITDE